MKFFDVTFTRTIETPHGKATETRKVIGVKASSVQTAQNKAFRKICFYTRYDHWKFSKIAEGKEVKEVVKQEEML